MDLSRVSKVTLKHGEGHQEVGHHCKDKEDLHRETPLGVHTGTYY